MTIKEFKIQLALGTLTHNIKVELANNTNTPTKVLTKLSTDKDWFIRYWVAHNPNTPTKVLVKLSKDKSGISYWAFNTLSNRNIKHRK